MPIEYYVDHQQRLVIARGFGAFGDSDVFGYQAEVWSQPEVKGYDELVDMTDVEAIATPLPAGPRMQKLAAIAAADDDPGRITKFAIVAPGNLAFGLGRQFQTYRAQDPRSTKQIAVFRTMAEALAFLGGKQLVEGAPYRRSG